jgi:hypothetical protein
VNYHAILLTFHQLIAPFPAIPGTVKEHIFSPASRKTHFYSLIHQRVPKKISLLGSGKAFAQTSTTSSLSPDQR